MLTTTKMYNKKKNLIERSVAGASKVFPHKNHFARSDDRSHDTAVRESQDNQGENNESNKDNADTDRSMCESTMNRKDKQKYRKNKRKRVKKYIKQGKLPANYDELPKEQKDHLYNQIRNTIESQNLKKNEMNVAHNKESAK